MEILALLRGSWEEFWGNRFDHSYDRFERYKSAYESNYDPRKTKRLLMRMWIESRIMDICMLFS